MTTVVAFGELLLRLTAPGHERLLQSARLDAHFGGAEANVAVALAQLGQSVRYVGRLPESAVGDAAIRALRAHGVDTRAIARGGERLGLYFAETGVGPRGGTVIYDRAHSSIVDIDPDDVAAAIGHAGWFHTTGITPALGPRPRQAVAAGLRAARAAGAVTSLDVNYRASLWSPDEARAVLRPLLRDVDVLIAGVGDLATALGIEVPEAPLDRHAVPTIDAWRSTLASIADDLGPRQIVVTTRRGRSASVNEIGAFAYDATRQTLAVGPSHRVPMIDRIGAGDALAAGWIDARLRGLPIDEALPFALAAGALKHTIPGDWTRVSADEVARVVAGDDGRVRR